MTPDPTPAASEAVLCEDCPPPGYSTDKTRCDACPRRIPSPDEPPAGPADLAALKNRVDTRLNNHLCDMKEGWDDSVSGFNDAWDIVRAVFAEAALAASAAGADVRAFEAGAEAMREVAAKVCEQRLTEKMELAGSAIQDWAQEDKPARERTAALRVSESKYAQANTCSQLANAIRALPLPQRATTTEAGNGN